LVWDTFLLLHIFLDAFIVRIGGEKRSHEARKLTVDLRTGHGEFGLKIGAHGAENANQVLDSDRTLNYLGRIVPRLGRIIPGGKQKLAQTVWNFTVGIARDTRSFWEDFGIRNASSNKR